MIFWYSCFRSSSRLRITLCRDYRPMPELDRYDRDALDDEDYDPMDIEARVAAEQELRRRDREDAFGRRGDDALIYGNLIIKC